MAVLPSVSDGPCFPQLAEKTMLSLIDAQVCQLQQAPDKQEQGWRHPRPPTPALKIRLTYLKFGKHLWSVSWMAKQLHTSRERFVSKLLLLGYDFSMGRKRGFTRSASIENIRDESLALTCGWKWRNQKRLFPQNPPILTSIKKEPIHFRFVTSNK